MIQNIILGILIQAIVIQSKVCPSWECSSKAISGTCYYQENNTIQSGPFCESVDQFCYLSEYTTNQKIQYCQNVTTEERQNYMLSKYCEGIDFPTMLNCYEYCSKDSYCTGKNCNSNKGCNVGSFRSDNPQKSDGKDFNEKCSEDFQCISEKCDCVFSQDNFGRCSDNYQTSYFENFFNFICYQEYKSFEDQCNYYVSFLFHNYVNSFDDNRGTLTCLELYNDNDNFETHKMNFKSLHNVFWVVLAMGLIIIFIFIVTRIRYKIRKNILQYFKRLFKLNKDPLNEDQIQQQQKQELVDHKQILIEDQQSSKGKTQQSTLQYIIDTQPAENISEPQEFLDQQQRNENNFPPKSQKSDKKNILEKIEVKEETSQSDQQDFQNKVL